MKILAGEFIIVTDGEYSDKNHGPLTRARRDYDTVMLEHDYLDTHPDQYGEHNFDEAKYIAWLTRADGPLEEINSNDYWIGTYGCPAHRMQWVGVDPRCEKCDTIRKERDDG